MRSAINKKTVVAAAESVSRLATTKSDVARSVDTSKVKERVTRAAKPPSLSSNMKKAGLIMIASPDVVTDIPGVALVAASYLAKRRDPAGFKELADETRKLLREMRTLRI